MNGREEMIAEAVQVDFALAIGTGRLEATVVVPGGEVTLIQLVPALHTLSSDIIASTVSVVESEGYRVSCKAGCGACCRQLVLLSLFEAEALGEWIRTLPTEKQSELAGRFDAALVGLRDAGVLQQMDLAAWTGGATQTERLSVEYLQARVACPFLVEESCSIHPIRPLICREYLVTSPAEFCVLPTRETVTPVPMPVKLSPVMIQIGAQLEGAGKGWIPLVFLFAWMRAGARPGDAIRGSGQEIVYEIVKRVAAGS